MNSVDLKLHWWKYCNTKNVCFHVKNKSCLAVPEKLLDIPKYIYFSLNRPRGCLV